MSVVLAPARSFPRWVAFLIVESWVFFHAYAFAGLGLRGLISAHLWAALYSLIGTVLSRKEELQKEIDGYPQWSYWLALTNHFIALPVLLVCSLLSASSMESWHSIGFVSADPFARNVYYSIIGCMIKDAWLLEKHPLDLMGVGYFAHHLGSITCCTLCLGLDGGAGIMTLTAVAMELGSGLYGLHMLLQRSQTFLTYLWTMPASNIAVGVGSFQLMQLASCRAESTRSEHDTGFSELCAVLAVTFIVILRQYSWTIHAKTAWSANQGSGIKTLQNCIKTE